MGPVDQQMKALLKRFPGGAFRSLPSGMGLVTVPVVPIPGGWSKPQTSIRFVVPAGYPFAALDCFWADADLTLADGRQPQSAAIQSVPETGETGLWFSWHLTTGWNANRDTLSSWMNTVIDRFRSVQ